MQGTQLGSYELVRRLGEGGMAQVYLARDVRLGREVAVKVLDRRLAERAGFRERFHREARLAAQLDHPNIVPLYDFGDNNGALYLVMPYLSGGSLQEALSRAPFSVGEVVSYGTQLTDALDYAHERGVVHRDVKPANILLHGGGRLMLGDFGLAKILDGSPRPANRSGRPDAGTPEYMAPEQIQGRTDERSDLYGLGVVLYLLLTGRLPFSGSNSGTVMDGHLHRLPDPPRRINRAVTPAMEAVVLRALAKHPEDRFQRASEMGAALMEALVAGDAEPLPFSSGISGLPSSLPPMPPSGGSGLPQPPSPLSFARENSLGGRSNGQGSGSSLLPSLDVPVANSHLSLAGSASVRSGPTATPGAPASGGYPADQMGAMGAMGMPADFSRAFAPPPLAPVPQSPFSDAPLQVPTFELPRPQPSPIPVEPSILATGPLDAVALSQEQNSRMRIVIVIVVLLAIMLLAAGVLAAWLFMGPNHL